MATKKNTGKLWFKCLRKGRKAYGNFIWPPIGKWAHKETFVQTCLSGYHVTPASHLSRWWKENNGELFLVEARGANYTAFDRDKVAFAEARLVGRIDTTIETLKSLWKYVERKERMFVKTFNIQPHFQAHGMSFSKFNTIRVFTMLVKRYLGKMEPYSGYSDSDKKKIKSLATSCLRRFEALWKIDLGLPGRRGIKKPKGRAKVVVSL